MGVVLCDRAVREVAFDAFRERGVRALFGQQVAAGKQSPIFVLNVLHLGQRLIKSGLNLNYITGFVRCEKASAPTRRLT